MNGNENVTVDAIDRSGGQRFVVAKTRIKKKLMKNFSHIILSVIIYFITINCFAIQQNEKFWFAVNSKQTLSKNKKWISFIYSQIRFINKSHPWQAQLLEGGIGYLFLENETIWLGYRWTGQHPYNGFYQENRLFQQLIQERKMNHASHIIVRSRL